MLDYLFTAVYDDGSVLNQTQEDLSTKDSARSAFYDIDHSRLVRFGLTNEDLSVIVMMDLQTGLFQVQDLVVSLYDEPVIKRRLIYFRRVSQQMNTANGDTSTEIQYHIGWQGNDPDTGENIQRVLAFS